MVIYLTNQVVNLYSKKYIKGHIPFKTMQFDFQ